MGISSLTEPPLGGGFLVPGVLGGTTTASDKWDDREAQNQKSVTLFEIPLL